MDSYLNVINPRIMKWMRLPKMNLMSGNNDEVIVNAEEDNNKILRDDERVEDGGMDIFYMANEMEEGEVENSVKQLLGDTTTFKDVNDPAASFNKIYDNIKSKKNTTLNANDMLNELFPPSDMKNPFDERKIMMKMKTQMDKEDFEGTFLDKNVGDIF